MAFDKLKRALSKTRDLLNTRVEDLFVPGRTLEAEDLEDLEEALIAADIGVETTESIIEHMKSASRDNKLPAGGVIELLENELKAMVAKYQGASAWRPSKQPHVLMLVGVNGTGKTTVAGKLAKRILSEGGKPLLAASDTFRAAASDQLEIWAQRSGVDIVRSASGADPASVAFDAVDKAVSAGYTSVIIDTAGRLHTKVNLMEELKKIARVCDKRLPGAPHDVFLVLDATTGNNGLSQARLFGEAIGLTGIVLTKLDSTAKGGIALAIMREFDVPVRMVGVGEGIDDLIDFDSASYAEGLFEE
jgi:fused signal recognition particle receptor